MTATNLSVAAILLTLALATAPALAQVQTRSVDYKQGDTTLRGYLAWDEAPGNQPEAKRPGVLVVPEWWGLNDYAQRRTRELAALGYVALAVDMYGDGKSTTSAQEAGALATAVRSDRALMRARIRAALDTLAADPRVDPKRIAAIGYCFGGGVVLELARSGADVAGVVCFHGSLDTPHPQDAKNIKAKVLICNGADDTMVAPQIPAFEKEMRDAGVDWQFINYGGAVHAFTNPDADKLALSAGLKGIAYNAKADKRSWQAMKVFLQEVFAGSDQARP